MRNDLKDEPVEIPSLTIDDSDSLENSNFKPRTKQINTKSSNNWSKKIVFILFFLFIIYTVGMIVLFWVFKQAADDMRYQLDEQTHSTSVITESSQGQLKAITERINSQQAITKTGLESIREQNKNLANQLNKVLTAQQAIVREQAEYEKRLVKVEQGLVSLGKTANQSEQIKQLTDELTSLKKAQSNFSSLTADVQALQKQNLPQALKSVQDDLLLLRSQLDKAMSDNNSQQLESVKSNLEKQLQSLQTKVNTLQQQIDNRSPY